MEKKEAIIGYESWLEKLGTGIPIQTTPMTSFMTYILYKKIRPPEQAYKHTWRKVVENDM